MANWNKKNTGRPTLADNARASIELIADRIDNLEKGLAGDETLTDIDIKGGTLDNVPIGKTTPKSGAFTDITASVDITNTGDYKYKSAKTKIVTIPGNSFTVISPNAFINENEGTVFYKSFHNANGILSGQPFGNRELDLGFSLGFVPSGATITNITFYNKSSSGDNYRFRCYVYRIAIADGSVTTLDDTTEVYIDGNYNTSAVLNAIGKLDYSTYIYSPRIHLYNFNGNEDFYIYGAKITYTINNL